MWPNPQFVADLVQWHLQMSLTRLTIFKWQIFENLFENLLRLLRVFSSNIWMKSFTTVINGFYTFPNIFSQINFFKLKKTITVRLEKFLG